MPIIVTLSATSVAASTMIDRAMRLIGQISPGVSPTTDEYAVCLEALNDMLDSWRNERLMCYATQDESLTLVSGQASYTIGSAGDLNTNRPTIITYAYLVDNAGVSYDVNILNDKEYAAIGLKASTSTLPNNIYYAPHNPLGNLWVYPVPISAFTLHVLTPTPVMTYTTTATAAILPPGWREAIATNLAVYIAPEFETEASRTVMKMAADSKAYIKRVNNRPVKIYSDLAALVNPLRANILTNA